MYPEAIFFKYSFSSHICYEVSSCIVYKTDVGGKKKTKTRNITESSDVKICALGNQLFFPCVQGPLLTVISKVWQTFAFTFISILLPIRNLPNISLLHVLRQKYHRWTQRASSNKCRSQHLFNCMFSGILSLKGSLIYRLWITLSICCFHRTKAEFCHEFYWELSAFWPQDFYFFLGMPNG